MHHPTDRITHTTTSVTPVMEHWLEREIAQWVHHGRAIQQPLNHDRTLLPQSYISLPYNQSLNELLQNALHLFLKGKFKLFV